MAKFKFQAKTADGKTVTGSLQAKNETEARVRLRAEQLSPIKVLSQGAKGARNKGGESVPTKDLQIFTRQFATLVTSGVHLVQCLNMLAIASSCVPLRRTIEQMIDGIAGGKTLAASMDEHPKAFDKLYRNMIRAGEESGVLDVVLNRLAIYIEKSVKLKGKIKGAMFYPAVIISVAIAVIAGILLFVVPKFKEIFSSQGKELPGLTQMVIDSSEFMMSYWYIVFGLMGLVVFSFLQYYKTEPGKALIDPLIIKIPVLGDIVQKGAIARFSRTFSTLLSSGVPVVEALDISSRVVGNYEIERAFQASKDSITKGKSISAPLENFSAVPNMVVQMISVGEQTGSLDTMLGKIADFFEEEVDASVGALTSLIEPILMVVLGGIIAVLVVAMYLPIFSLAGAVGG